MALGIGGETTQTWQIAMAEEGYGKVVNEKSVTTWLLIWAELEIVMQEREGLRWPPGLGLR